MPVQFVCYWFSPLQPRNWHKHKIFSTNNELIFTLFIIWNKSVAFSKFCTCLCHTCQLSRFSWESPSFSSNLPISRLEHQISRTKWTFEHFCALVWNFTKFELFFIHCTVSGTFLHMFSQWQRLVRHYNNESTFWSYVRHVRCHILS